MSRPSNAIRFVFLVLLALQTPAWAAKPLEPALTLDQRIESQRKIEEVYWRHRLWPESNPTAKPTLSELLPDLLLRERAKDGVLRSIALNKYFGRELATVELRVEWERIASSTRAPEMLRELYRALDDDPVTIVESLVRPALAERLLRRAFMTKNRLGESDASTLAFDRWWHNLQPELDTMTYGTGDGDETISLGLDPHGLPPAPIQPLSGPCLPDTWMRTKQDRIEARTDHTVVWTGSEMIVFGGSLAENSGGVYNPVTDSWRPTRLDASTPSPRALHTAIWTGTEMIVWGGTTGTNSGGRYNPVTDTWTATAIDVNTPIRRSDHTAVWTGTTMIVWGGYSFQDEGNGGIYNPSTDSWSPLSLIGFPPSPRQNHSAIWTGSEMIVYGGRSYGGFVPNWLNNGARFDPGSGMWQAISGIGASERHSAVWTGTEMIIWGGEIFDPFDHYPRNTGGRYNPLTDTWTMTSTGANSPAARSGHVGVWTGSRMLVWGGDPGDGLTMYGDGALYNPLTDTWTPISSPTGFATAHTNAEAVWTGTEMLFFGGLEGTAFRVSETGGRYNPSLDSWSVMGAAITTPAGRSQHGAVYTGSEMIVWGGATSGLFPTNTGARYNPALDSWTSVAIDANTPTARTQHAMVWTGTRVLVWGGAVGSNNDGASYNPTTDSWLPIAIDANTPDARTSMSAVWTGTRLLIWGGRTYLSGPTETGGSYDPLTDSWATTTTAGAPEKRANHTAVWTGSRMIVFGGENDEFGFVSNHGSYDPSNNSWSLLSSVDVPEPRIGHTAVWSGTRMLIWGGVDPCCQTLGASYDPTFDTWSPISALGPPVSQHTAIWSGNEMVVWGGSDVPLGVTTQIGSRYDPATDSWSATSIASATPSPRSGHTAVYANGADRQMVVWGGGGALPSGGVYCIGGCSAVAPGRVSGMSLMHSGSTTSILWPAVVTADRYDVVRGSVSTLLASGGNFTLATTACIANDIASTSSSDTLTPSAGDANWLLVRAANCGGAGSYDTLSPSQIGSRDAEIAGSADACP